MPHSPRSLPWPASQIDRDVIHELHRDSQDTSKPISSLIDDAVHAAMNARLEQGTSFGFGPGTSSPCIMPDLVKIITAL